MRFFLILLLLPTLAFGQGLNKKGPGQKAGQVRTNYAKEADTIFNTPWLNFGTTAAADTAPWTSVTSTNSGALRYQAITGMATSTKFVASVYAKKASGTGAAGMRSQGPANIAACTCYRSDGGTCTATFSGIDCFIAVTDLGTTEVRLVSVYTTDSAGTGGQMTMIPGEWGVATGTTLFHGAQIESGVTRASKLCVTTTAAKTCKD